MEPRTADLSYDSYSRRYLLRVARAGRRETAVILALVTFTASGVHWLLAVVVGIWSGWVVTRPLERFIPQSRGDMVMQAFDMEEPGQVRETTPGWRGRRRFEV